MEHYVYLHRRRDNGDIFYVGKGKNGRAWYFEGRNTDWHAVAAEAGVAVEVIAYFYEHSDAIAFEKETIALLGLWEPLVNRTCGGEGSSSYRASPETRAKLSAAASALHANPEYTAKQSAAQKARYASPEAREEARQRSLRCWEQTRRSGVWEANWLAATADARAAAERRRAERAAGVAARKEQRAAAKEAWESTPEWVERRAAQRRAQKKRARDRKRAAKYNPVL